MPTYHVFSAHSGQDWGFWQGADAADVLAQMSEQAGDEMDPSNWEIREVTVEIESQQTWGGWVARLTDEADEHDGGWSSPHPTREAAEAAIRDYAYRRRGLQL